MKNFFVSFGLFLSKHKKGFIIAVSLVIFTINVLLGAFLFTMTNKPHNASIPIIDKLTQSGLTQAEIEGKRLSNGNCQGREKRKLTTLPMKTEDFSMIIPYGLTVGDHVTPIDHQYFSPTIFRSPRDTYEVFAMADSILVDVQPRIKPEYTEYRMVFSISCTLFYYYDLVTSLAPDIAAKVNREDPRRTPVNIPVKAGQVIGRIGGQTLDFAVWDMDIMLKGFIVPENYGGESWKIHTVDPLEYYTDDLKKQALSKYIRTVPPLSGKIDYDIDGKLIGNWFQEGTNGYEGLRPDRNRSEGYSRTHFAIAPGHIDPSAYIISFGDFGGQFKQFALSQDSADPAQVDIKTGLVKYALYSFDYKKENGERWDGMSFAKNLTIRIGSISNGCALLEMQGKRTLKMEVFPNAICQEISGFSANAKLYER